MGAAAWHTRPLHFLDLHTTFTLPSNYFSKAMEPDMKCIVIIAGVVLVLTYNAHLQAQGDSGGAKSVGNSVLKGEPGGVKLTMPPEVDLEPPTRDLLSAPAPAAEIEGPPGGDERPGGDESRLKPILDPERPADSAADLDERIRQLEQLVADQRSQIDQLGRHVRALQDKVGRLSSSGSQFRARQDPSGPSQGQQRQMGKLVIDNETGTGYYLTVNGMSYLVMPGRRQLDVPVGDVVTQLNGYEAPKTWRDSDWRNVNGEMRLSIRIR